MIKVALAAFVGFIVLDGIWLGLLMKNFYRDELSSIARIENGGFAPVWPAAFLVYVLLAVGVAIFVVPGASGPGSAGARGALLGLVIYGVYDLTSYSTLARYPLTVAIVDICWGIVATASCSFAVRFMHRLD